MEIDTHYINTGHTPAEYIQLMETYAEEGKSTGTNQSEAYLHYTKLNAQRMKRLMKTAKLSDEMSKYIGAISQTQHWIILTESWCGDAANSIPFFLKMAELNPKIEVRLLLRDENLELMDQFLTNGGRSIPKVIALDAKGNHIADWGPRPTEAQKIYTEWRESETKVPYQEIQVTLQKWYNQDKGIALQHEWLEKLMAAVNISYSH